MTPEQWNELLATTLCVVRAVDPDREVLVGPVMANAVAALSSLELPNDPHLTATVHYYSPFAFTHQGAWWEPGSAAWIGTTWSTAADRAAVTADLVSARS